MFSFVNIYICIDYFPIISLIIKLPFPELLSNVIKCLRFSGHVTGQVIYLFTRQNNNKNCCELDSPLNFSQTPSRIVCFDSNFQFRNVIILTFFNPLAYYRPQQIFTNYYLIKNSFLNVCFFKTLLKVLSNGYLNFIFLELIIHFIMI